jgi:hypothetical protein
MADIGTSCKLAPVYGVLWTSPSTLAETCDKRGRLSQPYGDTFLQMFKLWIIFFLYAGINPVIFLANRYEPASCDLQKLLLDQSSFFKSSSIRFSLLVPQLSSQTKWPLADVKWILNQITKLFFGSL